MPRVLYPAFLALPATLLAACSSDPVTEPATPVQALPGWSLGPQMPEAFGELATVALPAEGGSEALVVLSGLSTDLDGILGGLALAREQVMLFDPVDGAWRRGPDLPSPRHHAAAASLDGVVYVAGGAESVLDQPWQGERNLWRWQPGDEAWETLAPLPAGRWGHRMVAFDGQLYVVGGHGAATLEAESFVYDPAQDAWHEAAPIPEARDHLSVVVAEGRIWAIAGRNGGITNRVDIYDPASDTWEPGPALPAATSGAAEAYADGRIFIFGGEDPDPLLGRVIDEHWTLDVRGGALEWETAPPPPVAVHGADGAVFDGRPVIVGGATLQGELSILAWTAAFQRMDP